MSNSVDGGKLYFFLNTWFMNHKKNIYIYDLFRIRGTYRSYLQHTISQGVTSYLHFTSCDKGSSWHTHKQTHMLWLIMHVPKQTMEWSKRCTSEAWHEQSLRLVLTSKLIMVSLFTDLNFAWWKVTKALISFWKIFFTSSKYALTVNTVLNCFAFCTGFLTNSSLKVKLTVQIKYRQWISVGFSTDFFIVLRVI